ncbi:hypothetical protein MRB53_032665 [Persea americana]|uniref:Uncharacterized protein n=1 Tax=Persea americana TaxID=3435 RepID=A0ACC2KSH8_PERAE|nr:hypothetical protein MRB53_032665 [Persea americana]
MHRGTSQNSLDWNSPKSAAARIVASAIAGRYHLPSPPAQHRRRREKPQLLLSSGTEDNPDDPSQSITLCPSLHDRRRRCSVAVPSSPPRSLATCPLSPLKKKKATGLQLCSETETVRKKTQLGPGWFRSGPT